MTDIPEDVLKAAQEICCQYEPSDTAICMAILAERERCAKIAEDIGRDTVIMHGSHIADEIRRGNPSS